MDMDMDANLAESTATRYCARHPGVETVISCGRCDTPICPRCLVYTPVGMRCAACAQLRRLPQYTVTPKVYARVIPGALLLGLGIGFILSFVPGLSFIGGILTGVLVAAGLRRVSGYKQGREMEIIAALTVILAVLAAPAFAVVRSAGVGHLGLALHLIAAPQSLGLSVLGIAIGIYFAVTGLR